MGAMATADGLIRAAIAERRMIRFRFDDLDRIAEPHDYGLIQGTPRLLVWQVAGGSRSGRLPDWRLVGLDKASGLELLDGRFDGPRPTDRHYHWERLFASVSYPPLRLVE